MKARILRLTVVMLFVAFFLSPLAFGVAANNPVVYAPEISTINVDGDLADWEDSSNWALFGPWYEQGIADGTHPEGVPSGLDSVTKARYAWNDVTNLLYIAIESTEGEDLFLEIGGLFGDPNDETVTPIDSNRATQIAFEFAGGTAYIDNQLGEISAGVVAAYQFDGTTMTVEIAVPIYSNWEDSGSAMDLSSPNDIYLYANLFNVIGSTPREADSQVADGKYMKLTEGSTMERATLVRLRPTGNPLNCDDIPAFAKLDGDTNLDCKINFDDFSVLADDLFNDSITSGSSIVYESGFEEPKFSAGTLSGQDGWTGGSGTLVVSGTAHSGSQYTEITDTNVALLTDISDSAGSNVCELWFYGYATTGQNCTQSSKVYTEVVDAMTQTNLIVGGGVAQLKYQYWDGSAVVWSIYQTLTQFKLDEWNKISYVFDYSGTSQDSFDIYLNGILQVDNAPMKDGGSSIDHILLGGSRTVGTHNDYDDISISVGVPERYYDCDFENPPYTLGAIAGQDSWSGPGDISNTIAYDGIQALRIVDSGTVYNYIGIAAPNSNVCEFMFYGYSTFQNCVQASRMFDENALLMTQTNLYMAGGRGYMKYQYWDGSAVVWSGYQMLTSFKLNGWNKISYVFDYSNDTFDIYINGYLEVDNEPMRDGGSRIEYLTMGGSRTAGTYNDYDNFVVSEGFPQTVGNFTCGFENPPYTVGTLIGQENWIGSSTGEVTSVGGHSGAQSMQITNVGICQFFGLDLSDTNACIFEFWFYGHNTGQDRMQASYVMTDQADAMTQTVLSIGSVGPRVRWQYYDSGTDTVVWEPTYQKLKAPFNYNGWNKFTYVLDFSGTSQDSFDIYVNGVLEVDNAPMKNGGTRIDEIRLAGPNTDQFTTANYDDIRVGIKSCEDTINMDGRMSSDFNSDCLIDMKDVAIFVEDWLNCNEPFGDDCIETWL